MTTESAFNEQVVHMKAGFAVTATASALSVLGAIGIIISYIKCPEQRNTMRQLLLVMTVADCLVALSNLSGAWGLFDEEKGIHETPNITEKYYTFVLQTALNKSPTFCVVQSFVSTTSYLVSYFYDMFIACYFYTVAVVTNERRIRKRIGWIHVISWMLPLSIVTAALLSGVLGTNLVKNNGNTGPWCWIRGDLDWNDQIMWTLLTGKGWEFIAYLLGPLVWCLICYQVRKHRPHQNESRFTWINVKMGDYPILWFREDDWNFRFVPLILYLLRLWGTVRYITALIELHRVQVRHLPLLKIPDAWRIFVYLMQCLGDNLQGFINFLLFCVADRQIRTRMMNYLCGNPQDGDVDENTPILQRSVKRDPQDGDVDENTPILPQVINDTNYFGPLPRCEKRTNIDGLHSSGRNVPVTEQITNRSNYIDPTHCNAPSPAQAEATAGTYGTVSQAHTVDIAESESINTNSNRGNCGEPDKRESIRSHYSDSYHSINNSFFSSYSAYSDDEQDTRSKYGTPVDQV